MSFVYIGTYTGDKSKGIYLFQLQAENPSAPQNIALAPLGLAAETPSPSFLELDVRRRLLFAVNELNEFNGKPGGGVSSFAIDRDLGKLTPINQESSVGGGPCHLVLDKERRYLLVANYGGGSVTVLPVGRDGRLGAASDFVQHTGSSVNSERQRGPHAHCVTMDPDNRFAFVCDLGLDKVMVYRFDAQRGKLTPHDPPFAPLKPGSGPRHMVFRPDGRFAYVNNELTSTVTVFSYDKRAGALKEVQTITTLPAHFEGTNSTAEIDVHRSGKFLYVSNRGHNSVVLFNVDGGKGTLTHVEDQSTGGSNPRHFGIDPSGKYMAIGNQNSDTVLMARIDGGNGRLTPSGVFTSTPIPICMKFLPEA